MPVNLSLPDVSSSDTARDLGSLRWVGMQQIDLAIHLADTDCSARLHALADVQVDLPSDHIKGIHMSRLYRLLDSYCEQERVTPASLAGLLEAMVASHRDCDSRSARVQLDFKLLVRRPALVSAGLAGWRAYPVTLTAELIDGRFTTQLQTTVVYSSTCPCSAALARQLVEQRFKASFADREQVNTAEAADWLRQFASLATPHSQRSEARINIDLPEQGADLGLLELIDLVESTLGTPVQTAVKREDEQAFAALNGQNLMFVEDAARRIQHVLKGRYGQPRVHVCHLESLHAHDAAAWAES